MQNTLGFNKNLFVLPFDHRGSFQEKMFGIKGRKPTDEETAEIASYKDIIYQGFKLALQQGVPQETAGILVDEQFGSAILIDAKKNGYTTACPAEKSGQNEFDFEFGSEYGAHIAKFGPTFVKVLVRMNPEDDAELNKRQMQRLKELSDYCHDNNNKFMFELLVPATAKQLERLSGDQATYDRDQRPKLMLTAMKQIQDFGIEPDVWKLEGVEKREDVVAVANLARAGKTTDGHDRTNVGVILLGRGENAEKVKQWLTVAASVPGLIGFAVGRTVFWEPLKAVREGRSTREDAAKTIADTFGGFCKLWVTERDR